MIGATTAGASLCRVLSLGLGLAIGPHPPRARPPREMQRLTLPRPNPPPGREVNMRKNPNGPAARKPGDMLKDLQL